MKRVSEQGQNFCNHCNIHGPENCDQTDQRYLHGKADLSPDEFLVLRAKVRSLPCMYGTGCPQSSCASGHHCRNGKNCTMNTCRFADTHHMDIVSLETFIWLPAPRTDSLQRPYKKVFDDGTTELY